MEVSNACWIRTAIGIRRADWTKARPTPSSTSRLDPSKRSASCLPRFIAGNLEGEYAARVEQAFDQPVRFGGHPDLAEWSVMQPAAQPPTPLAGGSRRDLPSVHRDDLIGHVNHAIRDADDHLGDVGRLGQPAQRNALRHSLETPAVARLRDLLVEQRSPRRA